MMSVVEVEVTYINKPPVTVRASVSVKERETGKYVYTDTVSSMNDPYYREQVLQDALVDLRRFQNKYHALTELADLMGVISQTIRNNDQLAKARAAKRAARTNSKKPKGTRSKK
jgi:predicted house-cleaning noncanonical NTP pyrophosphatase (MazG superfamily)